MMFLAYAVIGGIWAWFCYRHLQDLLPIQASCNCEFLDIVLILALVLPLRTSGVTCHRDACSMGCVIIPQLEFPKLTVILSLLSIRQCARKGNVFDCISHSRCV